MTENSKLTGEKLLLYCMIFFAAWCERELVIRPVILDSLNGVAFELAETAIKLIVWTLPALLLCFRYRDQLWTAPREMLTNTAGWYKFTPIIALFLLYNLVGVWIAYGGAGISADFMPHTLIGGVVFVGITEEVVFRGWLLNAFLTRMSVLKAVALNSGLFVLIHFPIWIYRGTDAIGILEGCIITAALGVLFSWAFIKSKGLLVPVILHMAWNLCVILFFG